MFDLALKLLSSLFHQSTFLGEEQFWLDSSGDGMRGWPVATSQQPALHPESSSVLWY
jgi:hypothetical protein